MHRLPAGKLHGFLLVVDLDLAFGLVTLDGEVLKLPAIGRLGDRVQPMAGELRLFLIGLGWDRKTHEHRVAVVGDALGEGRVPAPVLQMAVLAGAGIEQRPEPVGGIGRSRRRHPVLAEDGVADLEVELALEVHVAGGGGEGVGVGHARLRGGTAAGLVLALLGLGEIRGRRGEAGDARIGARAMALPGAKDQRQARAKRNQRGKRALTRRDWLRRCSAQCWDNATAGLGTVSVQSAYVRT